MHDLNEVGVQLNELKLIKEVHWKMMPSMH